MFAHKGSGAVNGDSNATEAPLPLEGTLIKYLKGGQAENFCRVVDNLVKGGHGSVMLLSISAVLGNLGEECRTKKYQELRDIFHFARHVLHATGLFVVIALPAIGLETVLAMYNKSSTSVSPVTVGFLHFTEYGILALDIIVLFYRLVNSSWIYLRRLTWQ
jgi:hypothetical protein